MVHRARATVNIRLDPSLSGEDVGNLPAGSVVEVLEGGTAEFAAVQFYVYREFLEEVRSRPQEKQAESGHQEGHRAPGSAMKTSPRGLEFIKKEEGCILHVYKDPAGYPTIGVGHLIKEGEEFGEISKEEALDILAQDLEVAEDAINRLVKVLLSQDQFDALVSFVFNVGAGQNGFAGSTLLKLLNQGQYDAVPGQMARWQKAKGQVLPGLVARRKREGTLWGKAVPQETAPAPSSEGVPIQQVLDAAFTLTHTDYRMGAEIKPGTDPAKVALTDCSETVEFACREAGVQPVMPDGAMYQYAHCHKHGTVIPVAQAIETRGALLFKFGEDPLQCVREDRRPSTAHVAFSLGGGETFEARGTEAGVGYFDDAWVQNWTHAALIPGVDYA